MSNHESGPESVAPEFFKPRRTWYPADEPDQPGWPPGVEQITVESLGMTGIDREGRLHWRGARSRSPAGSR